MSIEDETAPVADETPVTEDAAPETGTPAPESDPYEKRYADLRSEFNGQRALRDRARQGDRDAFNELLEGRYELPDEEVPDPGDDLGQTAYQDPRVDELIQERQQERQTERLGQVGAHIDSLAGEKKWDMGDLQRNAVVMAALQAAGGDPMRIDADQVVELFNKAHAAEEQRLQKRFDAYLASKKNAPHVSSVGTGATGVTATEDMNRQELTRWATERLAQAQE